jgi:cell wall-associated NlpC family hydrolase
MWSWAHGGVSLSHSSAAQYAELPHLSRDQLRPGDLLFFYSPIHHVALYVGGGQVIEALHPGTTVLKDTPDWDNYVGAARPG